MKKKFTTKIVSLALCAASCLVLGVATLIRPSKEAKAEVAIKEMHTLQGFKLDETAAIRKELPGGIRFTTEVSQATQEQIKDRLGEGNIVYGTLILPADLLGDAELTHNTHSVAVAEVEKGKWTSSTMYTTVLGGKGGSNLGESYYNRPIAARSFAINKDTGVVYYTENTAIRSLGYVAYKAANGNDGSDYIDQIVAGTTKELVFNENISIQNSEEAGLGLVVNKYEKQSADVFAVKIGGIIEEVVISYTSNNESVIDVVNGELVAVGSGAASVTGKATLEDGSSISFTKEISTHHYTPSTQYKILLPANASDYEKTAANKIQDMILEATGVELAIVTESGNEKTTEKYLSVGDTALAKTNCDVSDLTKNSASRVKTVGNTVFLRGATPAGTLYGAQKFLEETVGYQYYLDKTYVVETTKEVVIADKDYTPIFNEVWQMSGADKTVAEEHGANGYTANLIPIGTTDEEDAEGTYRFKGAAHNSILFFNEGVDDGSLYSSSSKSYKKWYATNSSNYYITGKSGIASLFSGAGKVELCYTAHGDDTVRNQMIEKLAAEMFRKMTEIEEFKSYNRVAFSHNDTQSWCTCSNCRNAGNPSDNMLKFILDVAASLKTKLANAGDARANTFKICTLFYNETNLYPTNIASYQSAVDNYMQHVEVWFAETRADYHVSLETPTEWNETAKSNFDNWTTLANSKGADVLWWGYYASAKTSFIPYNSIDALRANYALAANAGVDYMFNQMMQYNVNWSRLKQYLASELRWNATPDDNTWDGWIAEYMNAAFGPGATAMTEYYDAWKTWAEANEDSFENATGYSGSGIYKQVSDVCTTGNMSADALKAWITSCDKALAALDVKDENYTTYYKNIVLEKMTPLYLIMHLYGFNYDINSSEYDQKTNYSVKNEDYVTPYAQDFLDAATIWNVSQDGEMNNLADFKAALEALVSGVTAYEDTSKQIVLTDTSITLNNANIASGESYSATLINSAGEVAATGVTVNDGSATLTFASAPTAGISNVVLRSASKVITFSNVVLATGFISSTTDITNITKGSKTGYFVLSGDVTYTGNTINQRSNTFKGVLDGNGYTIYDINTGANGLFNTMTGATVKNINFVNFTATAGAFAITASDTTFENVSVSFAEGSSLVTTSNNCTYNNVTVYTSEFVTVAAPEGVKVIVGEDTGKTFYIPEGENEVWLRDSRLVKGNYTVDINGEISNASIFAAGKIKVSVKGLALGDTLKVSCDNGENAYVYNVMRVAKLVQGDAETLLPVYNGDKTALGYYNTDLVQTLVGTVASGWDNAIWNDRAIIKASGKQDYISVDFVSNKDITDTIFQIWPSSSSNSMTAAGVTIETAQASIVDEHGLKVSSIAANKRYTLRVYDPNATRLAIGVYGTNTIYFGNVTYGKGMPAEPITPPDVWVGDSRVLSVYSGDVTKLGYDEGTLVFPLENNTPDNIWGDGWGKRMIFGAPGTQDYITLEFVTKEDVEYTGNTFHVWGKNGSPSMGDIAENGKAYPTAEYPNFSAIILDEYGLGVTDIKAGKHYFMSIECAGMSEIQIGALDSNVFYIANVEFNNGSLPTAIQPLVYGVDNSALSVYEGDETALGFEEGTLVFESTAGASTWNDNAVKFYTDSASNCLTVNFAFDSALAANVNQFMIWTSEVDGAAAFINNCQVTQNAINIEIFDEDGNVATSFEANKKYTFKIYHEGATHVTIALVGDTQAGKTIYYSNDYADSNDEFVPPVALPENIVKYSTDGGHTGETLPQYAGDATQYGWTEDTYVFEANMTAAWDDRVVIPVDSANYDYMDVEFVVTSGAWYFNAWVVNADGMLDGNYLVAENASNATYGSGYAPHTPNTGANGGKTKIQVLDLNGNVLTGGRSTLGTRYILRVYLDEESLTQVHIGQANTSILFANVTFGVVETITADSTNASAVTVYSGDVTALGFAEGSRVYEYVGADSSKDKAVFSVDSANYDYVDVQLVIASGDGYFFAYALSGGSYLNNGSSYVIDPSNIRLASGNAMDRTIKVFDANGNAVSTLMSTNTLYTLRIYINGADQIKIAKTGSTIYLANVTFGNDAAIEKPEEVVVYGETKEELPQYTGNPTDIGFAETDWVFEQTTTNSSWSGRAHIGNNSEANFLVFDFAMPNPQNLTVWFTRSGNVIAGFSNIMGTNGAVWGNESAARIVYVFDENNVPVSSMSANTKYTAWVYLDGADDFDGIAIGCGDDITVYYANVRYVYGTGENILRQSDANKLLPVYDGDVTSIGFEENTFVQTLVGTSDGWVEDIYANRARITADGTQDYIAIDFVAETALTGDYIFYLWSASANGNITSSLTCTAFTISVVDELGFKATSVEAGKRYTLYVYDPSATYLAIGAYCNNTIYFANVRYGNGDLPGYDYLKDGNGVLATYEGDVTQLGFDEGEYVQQWAWTPSASWDSTAERNGVTIYGKENSYTSIMFSLAEDFTSTGSLFFAWTHAADGSYVDSAYFYVYLAANNNARIVATNGEVLTDTLKANTVYMLELYFPAGVTYCNLGNITANALTVSFATKTIKTYATSIANSPVTGSTDNTVTVSYNNANLGFGRNEVVKQLETETVSNVWGDAQPTSGKTRPAWLIKVAAEAGQKVTIRFALSQDFNSTGMLFYVWAYSDNSGTCPANGSVSLSGSSAMTASITDEAGNAVTSLKAGQVYELTLYVDTAIKYDIGNFVAEGMITYVSSEVTYEAYAG